MKYICSIEITKDQGRSYELFETVVEGPSYVYPKQLKMVVVNRIPIEFTSWRNFYYESKEI